MKKYNSSSSFTFFQSVLASIMIISMGIGFLYSIDNILVQIITILSSLAVCATILIYQRKNVFEIEFNDELIEIDFFYTNRKIAIEYSELLSIEYISTSKNPTKNKIEYKINGELKKLKFTSVAHSNEYVEFIKFLKSKNDGIKWKVFPSNDIMNHKLQKVYGFKYR
ncbi:hypothetical protein [Polaribacter sp. Asnod6-C07]|uniref:hypothetical protein n=1 Tax=Polaribacter sp. Asnod6-C07 TaxID=3160582 RepID=UPI0038642086